MLQSLNFYIADKAHPTATIQAAMNILTLLLVV